MHSLVPSFHIEVWSFLSFVVADSEALFSEALETPSTPIAKLETVVKFHLLRTNAKAELIVDPSLYTNL